MDTEMGATKHHAFLRVYCVPRLEILHAFTCLLKLKDHPLGTEHAFNPFTGVHSVYRVASVPVPHTPKPVLTFVYVNPFGTAQASSPFVGVRKV